MLKEVPGKYPLSFGAFKYRICIRSLIEVSVQHN